ncbi:hypothetical protein LJR220_006490 [Bradyrhizobium sp. LjRoot220]|uniref:hypothetical protein n=1 Tax=Bradyrhizobium sp. LjRoot220 TaxID=3342284 RepID=UPI003ED11137
MLRAAADVRFKISSISIFLERHFISEHHFISERRFGSERRFAKSCSRRSLISNGGCIDRFVENADAVQIVAAQVLPTDASKSDVAAVASGAASPLTGIQGFRVPIRWLPALVVW